MTNYKPTDMLNYINKIPDIIKNVELIGKDVTTLKVCGNLLPKMGCRGEAPAKNPYAARRRRAA